MKINTNKQFTGVQFLLRIALFLTMTITANTLAHSSEDFLVDNPLEFYETSTVYEGDITVNSQVDVNSLPENITEITGKLDILGTDIDDLSKFSSLTAIGGRLLIQDSESLTDLSGLKSLQSIGASNNGELVVRRMDALVNLNGLQALTHVERRVSIYENPVLTSLDGLNNLAQISDNSVATADGYLIRVYDNASLADFCGLNGIVSAIGSSDLDNSANDYISGNESNPSFQDIGDGTGCSSLSSGSKIPEESSFLIYPNPVSESDVLYIKNLAGGDVVALLNIAGQVICEIRHSDAGFDFSDFPTGVYFLKIKSGSGVFYEKLLKN